jgi:hypothetical protein
VTDIDELQRRSGRSARAYVAAVRVYLVAVEENRPTDELATAARHVVAAAGAAHDADWELHEALEEVGAHSEEVSDADASVQTASELLELWEEILAAHEGRLTHPEPEFRALTSREQEVLDFLLADDFPGAEELRAQLRVAKVRRYDRNAPSLDLEVDPLSAPPADLPSEPVVVETETSLAQRAAGKPWFELILFAANGYVYQLYCDGQYDLDEFPPLDFFAPPRAFPDADTDVQEDAEDEP